MDGLALPVLAGIFLAAAGVVWVAGTYLSKATDALDSRFKFGDALGGLVFLAVATNLPEIAIVGAASVQHQFDIATGNILGGIAIQTVVLVLLDGVGVKRRPLTNATSSLVQVLEGSLVVGLVALAIMGTLLPPSVTVARLDPSTVLIGVGWVGGLILVKKAGTALPWKASSDAPDAAKRQRGKANKKLSGSTPMIFAIFGGASLATLAGGLGLELSGNAIATAVHMNGAVFGGTVLAAATALPEVTTGLAAVRMEDFELAVSDIFGGNAFLVVLFLPATILSGQSVLAKAHPTDVVLAALGIVLTAIYIGGLLFRPRRQYLRLGPDSIAVLVTYILGILALVAVSRS